MSSAADLFRLDGKVALVTGASKGIGEAMARGLAEMGAAVVVSSRKQEAVDAVAASINQAGHRAAAVAANVGRLDEARQLVERTVELLGGLDILVNNAATNPVYGPILETDEGAFDKIMAVNVKGPLELARRAHAVMAARSGGSVINVSSVGGLSPEPGLGLYSMSKAALISLTKTLAQEWARDGIRVNAICPGLIRTKFSAALWQDAALLQRALEAQAIPRIGLPEDLVGLTLFLASAASAYCTGSVYLVDGGYTI